MKKYKLKNGNMGIKIQSEDGNKYFTEFRTNYIKPSFLNCYGLIATLGERYYCKEDSLDALIDEDDYIAIEVKHSNNPVKSAYQLVYVKKQKMESNKENRESLKEIVKDILSGIYTDIYQDVARDIVFNNGYSDHKFIYH